MSPQSEREKQKKLQEQLKKEEEAKKKQAQEEIKRQKSLNVVQKWHQQKQEAIKEKKVVDAPEPAQKKVPPKPVIQNGCNFEEWLRKKQEHKEAEKQESARRVERIREKCRESGSSLSFQEWLKKSKSRPKPVPLNRGFETLKGSTTKMYKNPIPWKNLID